MRIAFVFLALATASCGVAFAPVRPSEPIAATAEEVRFSVDGVWLSRDVQDTGMGDDAALVVQLAVENRGRDSLQISPAAFACLMELDRTRPGDTRSLLSAGGADGPFPDEIPEGGSLLSSIVVPAGQTRTLWALFRGYTFPDSDAPRRIVLRVPIAGGPSVELVLADPSRGNMRWQVQPARSAYGIGFRNNALFGGFTAQSVSTDITRVARAGPLLWDVGITSTLLVQSKGPLVSQTSSFVGSGVIAHVTAPVFRWGTALEPRQLGVFAGGAATFLIEIIGDRPADDMTPPKSYGALAAEVGIELDVGALRFAPTPFPLAPAGRAPLPRWTFRTGYTHASIGGVQADGYLSNLRLIW
jgi:hypothetical protein